MIELVLKYNRWIYSVCLFLNISLGITIIGLIPDDGESIATWTFLVIFLTVCEMVTLQLTAVILGFIFSKRSKITSILVVVNILILLATIIRYFF